MAHEVRNPLNSIALHAELLEGKVRGLDDPERGAVLRSVAALQGEVQRIDRILAQYLRHVGPIEGERSEVALGQLLDEAAAWTRPLAEQRGVALAVGPCPDERWSIDGGAIRCALDQVLGNAVEASRRGSTVALCARSSDGMGVIEVTDQGEGIVGDVLPRIFELGFSTRRQRAGLGLTVARQIVKGHGGTIIARSDGSGRGTAVRIELPLD
jgi:signal transduction histidine kinase